MFRGYQSSTKVVYKEASSAQLSQLNEGTSPKMQICVEPSTDPWRLPKGPWSCFLPLPPRLLLVGPSKTRLWPSTPCGPSLTPELKECLNLVPVNGGLLGQKDLGEVTIWKLNGSVLLKKLQLTTPEFCIENH